MTRRVRILTTLGLLVATSLAAQSHPDLRTRAETSDFAETSSYDDVVRIVRALVDAYANARWERFGESEEKRELPLLMLSEPPVSSPDEARKLGRPIVFVMANIHAGEVEGKEASLMLARRLTSGDLRPLLRQLVVLIAPIYNADGNEMVSLENRTAQNGPIAGVGTRENAKGLDLNRDYMKLETAEARSLVGLLARWDPHVTVDLHTTNGSYHGYHLTYAPSLNPNADSRLIGFARERLLPDVRQATQNKHGFRTYYYGNFASERTLERETSRVDPESPGDSIWRTFDHRPRFGNNYVGLRNRIAVLSEAYSYLDFRGRVSATEAYVEEVLRGSAAYAARILALTAQADRETTTMTGEMGVDFTLAALSQPVEILVGDVEKRVNPRSGKEMLAMTDRTMPVRMKDYGVFEIARRIAVPRGWLLPRPHVDTGRLAAALERLRQHGIEVQQVAAPAEITIERFIISELTRAPKPFQGHHEARLTGRYVTARLSVPEGAYFVPASQKLARLAFYLLEPESDDGFVTWNIIDSGLSPGETYPVYRVTDASGLGLKAQGLQGPNLREPHGFSLSLEP
jgi:hypothetical protein